MSTPIRACARRLWCILFFLAPLSLNAMQAAAQDAVLEVDQVHHAIRVDSSRDQHLLTRVDAHTFRLRRPASVQVKVVNTNTALYTVTTDETSAPPPSFESLRQFLAPVKAYIPELALVVKGGHRARSAGARSMLPAVAPQGSTSGSSDAARDALTNARTVESDLVDLDDNVAGSRGLNANLELAQYTLEQMRKGVEAAADALADSLGVPHQSCQSDSTALSPNAGSSDASPSLAELFDTYRSLRSHTAILQASLLDTTLVRDPQLSSFRGQLVQMKSRADSALANAQSTINEAYHTRDLTHVVLRACSHWESRPINVSRAAGRVITVHLTPRPDPELSRVAERPASTEAITILPPLSRIGATFGVTALYAGAARFHTYGVRATPAPNSYSEVYEATSVDDRFLYGLSLGFTINPRPNWRDSWSPVVWLPEITVAEAGSQHAVALGAAVSVWRIKVGAGALVVRHQELDNLTVHQQVTNANYLTTRDSYGRPLFYVSLSIINLEQLLGGGDSGAKSPSQR